MTEHTAPRPCGYRVLARALNVVVSLAAVVVMVVGTAWLLPAALGYDRYVITGGSMTGSIAKGSVVFTEPVDGSDLRVGDVVTYVPPPDSGVTTLVTHRIHDIRTTPTGALSFRTQGDANPDPDPWRFSLDQDAQPVVRFHVPYVGHLLIALADRETRILLVGVPAGLVGLGALVELVRALRGRGAALAHPTAPIGA